MKKFALLAGVSLLALSVAACDRDEANENVATEIVADENMANEVLEDELANDNRLPQHKQDMLNETAAERNEVKPERFPE